MTRSLVIIGAVFAASFVLYPVAAEHGDCGGDVIVIADLIYYVITGDTPDNGWGYLETNGEPGLQRGGGGVTYGGYPDNCQESENPDIRWY